MPVYFYDPPDRFVAGAVGQPGERIFYLQATSRQRVDADGHRRLVHTMGPIDVRTP